MIKRRFNSLRVLAGVGTLVLAACAGPNLNSLQPGVSTLSAVEATMGQPSMVWKNPDGSEQLAFAQGPVGVDTYMVFLGVDGKLQRISSVLNDRYFDQIQAGMTKDQVLRKIGPPGAPWTATYPRSNTLAWTWLYCASANFQNYFNVMFDASTGLVRSTGYSPVMLGRQGVAPNCIQSSYNAGG